MGRDSLCRRPTLQRIRYRCYQLASSQVLEKCTTRRRQQKTRFQKGRAGTQRVASDDATLKHQNSLKPCPAGARSSDAIVLAGSMTRFKLEAKALSWGSAGIQYITNLSMTAQCYATPSAAPNTKTKNVGAGAAAAGVAGAHSEGLYNQPCKTIMSNCACGVNDPIQKIGGQGTIMGQCRYSIHHQFEHDCTMLRNTK